MGLPALWNPKDALPNQPKTRRVSNPTLFPRCRGAESMLLSGSSARRTIAGTPGQEVKREALVQLDDRLSDFCFSMQQSEPIAQVGT